MTESITSLPAAVAALGALPMPVGPVPLSEARLAEYAAIDFTELMDADAAAVVGRMRNRLLGEIWRLQAEDDALQKRLHDAAMTRTWRNEDGKKFVFVEDIAPALLGIEPEGGGQR